MIPERETNQVTSTVQGERVSMGIDAAAFAHIMNVLTDLYSDKELAIIREYSTNALDSHTEAGETRPIEVSTPTPLRPVLTIRDYGVGLDAEGIRSIYSQYGASTKRGTNDAVGMLGLGCKSALSYTDQFTLVSCKDGERIVVSISRDADAGGGMTVLEAGPTDEPNGVEVSIPIKAQNEIAYKAAEFFAVWEPGTVLVDGKAPAELEGWRISDDYVIARTERPIYTTSARLKIVMGNVSYPAPSGYRTALLEKLPKKSVVYMRVPIGMVHFVPSREGLQDSPATRAALDGAMVNFKAAVEGAILQQVEHADSKPGAAKALIEARNALGAENLPGATYHGDVVPLSVPFPAGGTWINRPMHGSMGVRSETKSTDLDSAVNAVWVTEFDNANWSKTMRAKLNRYMAEHNLSEEPGTEIVIITKLSEIPLAEWLDGAVRSVTWDAVRKWKDPNRPAATGGGGGTKFAGTYGGFRPTGNYDERIPASELEGDELPIYFTDTGTFSGSTTPIRWALDTKHNGAYWLMMMPAVRAGKFQRLFPHAKPAMTAANELAADWRDGLTELQRQAAAYGKAPVRLTPGLQEMDPDTVDDPELSRVITAAVTWEEIEADYREASAVCPVFATAAEDEAAETLVRSVNARYPLAAGAHWISNCPTLNEHLTIYVNAAFAADSED